MKILCVAEKPSIARSISEILASGNGLENRAGTDQFCRNYGFTYRMPGTPANIAALGRQVQAGEWVDVTVTSVRGHVMHQEFPEEYQKWRSTDPMVLFTAPIIARVSDDAKKIARNLKAEVRGADLLMIWTDCDREGEHIGSEIVKVCREVKRTIPVKRARFSAIIATQIHRAMQHPVELDQRAAAAVESRIELDLRIGSAFTRFQTMFLQDRFRGLLDKRVISYGPCQFPTLGFVVEQYYKVMDFVPEPFWYIAVMHKREGVDVDFRWARNHLFMEQEVATIYEKCRREPRAAVRKVDSKHTRKFKPHPLTTVELQKAGGRLLRMAPKRVLDIAEKLYQRGLLSYPRTETDQYDSAFDFKAYIQKQTTHGEWGQFATTLVDAGANTFEKPINGRKNDQAHPPIHPTKAGTDLNGDEKRVYEYITRRFLASCSKHAIGRQTTITLVIADEIFTASGVVVVERNYLEVYPYDSWGGPALPAFEEGETFIPTKMEMKQGETSRPKLLTEADLVSLMDRNGIGTDATIAEHIAKIIEREYVMLMAEGQVKYLVPSTLGMGLAEGYNGIDLAGDKSLCKPLLRRETEERMACICQGERTKEETIEQSLREYCDVYDRVKQQTQILSNSVARYLLGEDPAAAQNGDEPFPPANGSVGLNDERLSDQSGPVVEDRQSPRRPAQGEQRGQSAQNASFNAVEIEDDEFDDISIINIDENESTRPTAYTRQLSPRSQPLRRGQTGRTVATSLSSSGQDAGQLKCRCPLPAVLRTVQKEGINKGKAFWSCSKPVSDPSACGFFEWDQPANVQGGRSRAEVNLNEFEQSRPTRQASEDSGNAVRRCQCGLQAQRLEATQAGSNQGRAFYKCPNISKIAQCRYFEWEDGSNQQASEGVPRDSSSSSCFTCGETGHWSSECPSRGQSNGSRSNGASNGGITRSALRPPPATSSRHTGQGSGSNAKRGKCFECGKTGHWASDCPNPGTSVQGDPAPRRQRRTNDNGDTASTSRGRGRAKTPSRGRTKRQRT